MALVGRGHGFVRLALAVGPYCLITISSLDEPRNIHEPSPSAAVNGSKSTLMCVIVCDSATKPLVLQSN